eukprot:15477358-Alexandrium_andersonii.AAC.1
MPGARRLLWHKRHPWPSAKAAARPSFSATAPPRVGPAPRQRATATSTWAARSSARRATASTRSY